MRYYKPMVILIAFSSSTGSSIWPETSSTDCYINKGQHGGSVVSIAALQRWGPGFEETAKSLYVLSVFAWISSGFLPHS
ncbi:hypothetical protein GDO81_018819 [Engystomops pustulosus]|uniref:Secreted protein n=1 Tax=Engystomops pustulosus TaxID=76066 RepID=A0AAV6YC90_ENGPU|nr:hypothetical protein GDO81_018819 [Engystomops pustulosus]